jgi:hypothetical protein
VLRCRHSALFIEFSNTGDYATFDQQAHQIGPVLKAAWEGGMYLQSAIRFDLTEGADDAMVKLFLGREF